MKRIIYVIIVMGLMSGCSRSEQADNIQSEITTTPATPAHDYVQEGLEYLKKGDAATAIKNFDQAIRQSPKNIKAYMALGETYMRVKDYDRAIDTFSAASLMIPNDGEVLYLLAVNHHMAGNIESATEAAQKSLAVFRQKQDQKNFARSLALLKSISNGEKQEKEVTQVLSTEKTKKGE